MNKHQQHFKLTIALFDDANPEGVAAALEKAAEIVRQYDELDEIQITHNRPFGAAYRMWYGCGHPALEIK